MRLGQGIAVVAHSFTAETSWLSEGRQELGRGPGCENRRDGNIVNIIALRKHLNQRATLLIITNNNGNGASSLCPHDLFEEPASTPHKQHNFALNLCRLLHRLNISVRQGRRGVSTHGGFSRALIQIIIGAVIGIR
jgi:hypothetical protein